MIAVLSVVSLASAQFPDDWELVWQDEFTGNSIDLDKWQHEITAGGGGNGEFQVYIEDDDNAYIQNEMLYIKTTPLSENTNPLTGEPFGEDFLTSGELDLEALYGRCTNDFNFGCTRTGGDIPPIASARLRTAEKFSFRYGYAEISAKMPVGDWLWPALWLLPDKWFYGGWPASGEIDMTEAIGNRNYRCNGQLEGIQKMGSTLHWGIDWENNRYWLTTAHVNKDDNNFGDSQHLYGVKWTPNGMQFYLDNELILSIPDPLINETDTSNCFTGFYDFGSPWSVDNFNPWTEDLTCDHFMAPFDQDFHFILNVAVGGTWYIPQDGCVNRDGQEGHQKPWNNGVGQTEGMWDFYNAKDAWYSTWNEEGDGLAMQVDYVRVYQPPNDLPHTSVPDGCPTPPGPNTCPNP
jgi:beta-glucanase (GH16 family)